MNIRKRIFTLVGTGVAAMLLTFGMNAASAKAESLASKASVVVNYEEQALYITFTDGTLREKEIMVNFPAVTINKDGEVKTFKESVWDIYETKPMEQNPSYYTVTVDLSSLNPAKQNYVILKGRKYNDPILIHFDPVVSSIKGSYDAGSKSFSFTSKNEELDEDFQYRTAYGTWRNYREEVSMGMYEQQGSTLYFRVAPAGTESVPVSRLSAARYGTDEKTYLQYNAMGTFASAECKTKVTKLRNAPKVVKVDLDNRAYVVNKGVEYRFSVNGDEDWIQASAKTTVKLDDEVEDIYSSGQFEIRYSEQEATAKKAYLSPSKVMIYDYPAVRTLFTVAQGSGMLSSLPVAEYASTRPTVTVEKTVNKKGAVTGVMFSNSGSCDYQVVVSKTEIADPATIPAVKTLKPKTLKAGKTLAYTKSTCPDGSYIYIRYASVKATGDWTSDYVSLGKLVLSN